MGIPPCTSSCAGLSVFQFALFCFETRIVLYNLFIFEKKLFCKLWIEKEVKFCVDDLIGGGGGGSGTFTFRFILC